MAERLRHSPGGDIRLCPDGHGHVWDEAHEYVSRRGPMDGTWLVAGCTRCGVGSLRSVEDPAGSVAALLGALAAHDCAPEPSP